MSVLGYETFIVDTKQRDNPETTPTEDCSVTFRKTFSGKNYKLITLKQMIFPFTFYNVRSGQNNSFDIELTTGPVLKTVSVDPGYYNSKSKLTAELVSQMVSDFGSSPNFTGSYDSDSDLITIRADEEFVFKLVDKPSTADLFGLDAKNITSTYDAVAGDYYIQSTKSPILFLSHLRFDLTFGDAGGLRLLSDKVRGYSFLLPIVGLFSQTINYLDNGNGFPLYQFKYGDNVTDVRIVVRDNNNNVVNLRNSNFQLVFNFF